MADRRMEMMRLGQLKIEKDWMVIINEIWKFYNDCCIFN